jgi:hypothetical protein
MVKLAPKIEVFGQLISVSCFGALYVLMKSKKL